MISEQIVFLVDDDVSICKSLTRGLMSEGFCVQSWQSAAAFLREHDRAASGCLVVDVSMPGLSGLELQNQLACEGYDRPIIFVTGQGTIPMSVQAMRAGAVTFLAKPVHLDDLVAATREALACDAHRREIRAARAQVESRLNALTARERQVLDLVIAGKMNKQIAALLGAAEKTIKVHRGRVMSKMNVRSVAELVTMTSRLGAAPLASRSSLR